jgi:hypothetical protein
MCLRAPVSRLMVLAALTAVVAAPALAGGQFPVPMQQGDVIYISGGVGDDEIAAMKAVVNAYDLLISNSEKDGSYTAGIDVTIRDGHGGVVLDAKNTGPLLYVKLPPGDYTLDALYHGVENVKETTIGAKRPTEINLIWPVFSG